MKAWEVNFDGFAESAYNFSGLSFGNLASLKNAKQISSTKYAAKRGLAKMKSLADMELIQGIIAPHELFDFNTLRRLALQAVKHRYSLKQPNKRLKFFPPAIVHQIYRQLIQTQFLQWQILQDKRIHFASANMTTLFQRSLEEVSTGAIFDDGLHPSIPITLEDAGSVV